MSCYGLDGTSIEQDTVCPSGVTGRYFCIKKPYLEDESKDFLIILEIEVFADVCSFTCDTTEYKVNDNECKNCPAHSTAPLGSTSITACACDAGSTGENGATCVASSHAPRGAVCTSVNVARRCYNGASACPITVTSENTDTGPY